IKSDVREGLFTCVQIDAEIAWRCSWHRRRTLTAFFARTPFIEVSEVRFFLPMNIEGPLSRPSGNREWQRNANPSGVGGRTGKGPCPHLRRASRQSSAGRPGRAVFAVADRDFFARFFDFVDRSALFVANGVGGTGGDR